MDNSFKQISSALRYIADMIEFSESVRDMPNCNTCKKSTLGECSYRPDWGKPVRYNCPLHRYFTDVEVQTKEAER